MNGYENGAEHGGNAEIRHYYGDRVRMAFLAAAMLSFIALPLWGNVLPLSLPAQIVGGLILVLLAGLTNPHSKLVVALDAVASGLGALLLEVTAITYHAAHSVQLLLVREAEVILLMLAFYYSVKTLRAMLLHKVGKTGRPWEFDDTSAG